MNFTPLELPGAYLVTLERHEDERGFFARSWSREQAAELGLAGDIVECSISRTTRTGTIRGLHFQRHPHEEVKLVRCTSGAIFDVIVDLRPDSATYRRWTALELRASEGNALYVPKGFAHGFQTLVEASEVFYMMSDPYVREAAAGVRWDDPAFAIEWPLPPSVIGERDRLWPDFRPELRSAR